jgi:hypothetical protein
MILLRDGKLVKIDVKEDSIAIIAVKTADILKKECPSQINDIKRDKVYKLCYDCDKAKYIFMLSQTPYGDDPFNKEYGVGKSGTGYHDTKGEAITKMLDTHVVWNENPYDIYFINGEERIKLILQNS